MKHLILISAPLCLMALALSLPLGCGADDDDDDATGGGYSMDSLEGQTLEFAETGGPTNTWTFAAETATLVGTGDFSYLYEKTGASTSVLTFEVGGEDRYDMTWTGETGGDFQESFDGAAGNSGTFTVK